jgi:exosortase A-associated hydrolase 2
MAALQARALAALGVGVLLIDLHGCGDSSGEFEQARWESWKDDLDAACGWLHARLGCPVGLWGLRLGALLALDYAAGAALPPARLLLWQPVTSGAQFLTQFLRLRLAADLLQGGDNGGTGALRAALQQGETLEIAGYALAPQLAAAIDALDAQALVPRCRVDWFELSAGANRPLAAPAQRVCAHWRAQGVELGLHQAHGQPFWNTAEITEAPSLLAATCALYHDAVHAA